MNRFKYFIFISPAGYGLEESNHSLFRLTGTFRNPGHYAGFLAVLMFFIEYNFYEEYKRIFEMGLRKILYLPLGVRRMFLGVQMKLWQKIEELIFLQK